MATHSSTLAGIISWTEEPGGLQSWGHKVSDVTEQLPLGVIFILWQRILKEWRTLLKCTCHDHHLAVKMSQLVCLEAGCVYVCVCGNSRDGGGGI